MGKQNLYAGEAEENLRGLPRYVTVTPDEGAVITVAVPWAQIEAAVSAAGYEIVPVAPAAAEPHRHPNYDCGGKGHGSDANEVQWCHDCSPHAEPADERSSAMKELRMTVESDGSISQIAGGPLEEPVETGSIAGPGFHPALTTADVARALIESDLIPRYMEYARLAPSMNPAETIEHVAATWAPFVLARLAPAAAEPTETLHRLHGAVAALQPHMGHGAIRMIDVIELIEAEQRAAHPAPEEP